MIKPNTCPYCGGRYTLAWSCTGPHTDDFDENTCVAMAAHRRLVQAGLDLQAALARSDADEEDR